MGYELQYQLFALIFQVMITQKYTSNNDYPYHLLAELNKLIGFYSSARSRLSQL